MTASLFLHQVIDANSRVVPGASLTFMQGFRKGEIYHDPERRTPARNPIRTDSAGRVRLYLNAGETYEVTVECLDGTRQQFVHVARADGETITETVEVDRVVYVADPAALARIAELEAQLAKQTPEMAEPVPVEIPAFLKPLEPPEELADLVDWTAPPKDRNEALLVKLREVAGLIGLAEDRGGRAAPELYSKRDRLESGIRYNRATLSETI